MGIKESYETMLPKILAVRNEDIITHMLVPIDIFIQEASDLYLWCQADKQILINAGLDWKTVEEAQLLVEALREAVARWLTQQFNKKEAGKLWKEKYNEVFGMWKFLLRTFRFAYRKNTFIKNRINAIACSQSRAALIQDLNNFSVLGKNNPAELKAINFDMNNLDKAVQLTEETTKLLSEATIEADFSETRKIKDQAFTLLKKTVDEICDYGQYLFWDNDVRKKGYSSTYLRRVRSRQSKSNTANEQETGSSAAGK